MQLDEVTFALGIPTCRAWMPTRAKSFDRLVEELGIADREEIAETTRDFGGETPRVHVGPSFLERVVLNEERVPNAVWSEHLWTALSEGPWTHAVQLQDDVRVAPNFWPALRAMCAGLDAEVICLEAAHPAGQSLAREGVRSYSTVDGLIGVGYVFKRPALARVVEWRKRKMKWDAPSRLTEDTLLAMFCVCHELPIVCPVPTIIDHDVEIVSSYGNDDHPFRRPTVTWRDLDVLGLELAALEAPSFWGGMRADLGRFYNSVHRFATQHVIDYSVTQSEFIESKTCPPQHARFFR